MKKKGFSGDGGARGVDGWACWRQTHLLKEVCVQTVSHALAREFQRRTKDRRMGRYFPARVPSEGRSEGGAPDGVLFGRNGGRQKISPVKVAGSKVFRRWFGFFEAS